jgi:hypothetical protein
MGKSIVDSPEFLKKRADKEEATERRREARQALETEALIVLNANGLLLPARGRAASFGAVDLIPIVKKPLLSGPVTTHSMK